MRGDDLPRVRTDVPGPASRARVDVLARHECPAITARRARRASALGAAHDDPIVWDEAVGANVSDVDGNVYVDLTSGFGVALVGHRHPGVVAAARAQQDRLLHAMGDAWPDATRIRLLERLAAIAPPGLDVAILGLSGSDAVEAARKTALLATGRPGVVAFRGGYHGLSLGALPLQGYRADFTEPFAAIVGAHVRHLPYGEPIAALGTDVGLVIVEPVLGRGGMIPAPDGWLAHVVERAHAAGALVAFDEIQCGLGRTGSVWAADVVPDLLCVGKALAGGFPLSACLGTRAVMDAWGASTGEALHTQTFLGHPVACAAALAVLDEVASDLPSRVAARGHALRAALEGRGFAVRGRGLMIAVVLVDREGRPVDALAASRALLRRGFLVLPAGADALGLTPPVCLTDAQIAAFAAALSEVCAA